nr:YtxH domain-containing protein [Nocardiopsis mwathae]
MQEVAREQAERLGPYAGQAKESAAQGLLQARGWTAPRLETAAHRVEDTVAPRVADLLTAAAARVEPNRARRRMITARKNGRRIPRVVVFAGVAAMGAAVLYGVLKLRQASQDAEWQENLDQAREQVRETRDKLVGKAEEAKEKVSKAASDLRDEAGDKAEEAREKASKTASQARKKVEEAGDTAAKTATEVKEKAEEKAEEAAQELNGRVKK